MIKKLPALSPHLLLERANCKVELISQSAIECFKSPVVVHSLFSISLRDIRKPDFTMGKRIIRLKLY